MRALFFIAAVFMPCVARSAPEVERVPAPAWVENVPVPDADKAAETRAVGGVIYLLSEQQRNAAQETTYGHWARKFTTPGGVQENARIAIDFAPDYQKLSLHKLVIHRDGEVIDRLPGAHIRLLEREEEMYNHVYNGYMTASVDVDDVRVGDVLEYAYSIRGANPVFNGVFSEFINTSWPVPVVRFQYRLLWPKDRYLGIQVIGNTPHYSRTEAGDFVEHKWSEENVPAISYDGDTPIWYSAGSWIQLSGYRDWAEVVEWALQFYSLDTPLPPVIHGEVDHLRELEMPKDRIVGALEYVQDHLRYLSAAEGVHSHKPYPMDEVVARGYGDCKDKARLLSAMLRALGFTADPALVASTQRQEIASWLPTPADFDHVIVVVELGTRTYWLDPTCDHQGGNLDSRYMPAYGKALIIRKGETGLSDVTRSGTKESYLENETTFHMPSYKSPVMMRVITAYGGREADWQRALLAANDTAQITRNYLNYVARQFPGVQSKAAPTFDDSETDNVLTTDEAYTIPKFWQTRPQDPEHLYAEVFPYFIKDLLDPPGTRIRTSPLGLQYPKKIRERFTIELPEPGNFPNEDLNVEDAAFRYSSSSRLEGRLLKVTYEYESLADSVAQERLPEYLENLRRARENLGYPLMVSKLLVEGGTIAKPALVMNWALLFAVIFYVVIAAAGAVFYFHWRPDWRMRRIHMEYIGLSGWLILVGIGTIIRPIYLLFDLKWFLPYFDINVWNAMAVPGQAYYDPLWVPVIFGELFVYITVLIFSILLIVLFFKKRRTFPLLFIILLATVAVFSLADLLVVAPLAKKFPQLGLDP
ncbi:MAG: DUF3857 domain-containing protein, partial [Chthoniobacterales bacterium]